MDVIVIGSGYAGLSVAALLARKGYKVLVLEKSGLLGGRAAGYRDKEGFYWEYGQHSHRLGEDGPAYAVFKALGETIDFVPGQHPPVVFYKGKLYPRPDSPLSILKSRMLSLRARVQIIRVLLKLVRAKPEDWYAKSLLDFYRANFSRLSEVEDFLNLLSFTIMVPRAEFCSAGELIDFLKKALKAKRKAGTPIGGSSQVLGKLEKIIRSNGEIVLNEEVKRIKIVNGAAVGVETDKKFYSARAVVFAAALDHLLSLVPESLLPEPLIEYAQTIEHTSSIMLQWVSEEPIAKTGLIMGVGIPLWGHFPTVEDPTLAPAGKHFAVFCWMLDRGKGRNPEHQAEAERNLRQAMETMFPGFAKKVVSEKKIFVPLQNGALLKPEQSRPFRPATDAAKIKGLYLAGDTTNGEGVSGDIAFSSALKAAELIYGDLG